MSNPGVFPCKVRFYRGNLVREVKGFHDTQVLGFRLGKTDLVWPIGMFDGDAIFDVDGGDQVRVFDVDLDFPEMDLPFAKCRRALLDWRTRTLRDARNEKGEYDPEKIAAAIRREGGADASATYLAQVFASDMKPDLTAKIFKRSWLDGLLIKGEAAWPLVIGALVFGLLEGWQLADTLLPDIAKSPWFSLLLPSALLVFVVILAFKEG